MADERLTLWSWMQEYRQHDTNIKALSKRKDELKKLIKRELMERCTPEEDGHIRYKHGDVTAILQVKRSMPEPDEGALQQLLIEKGLWNKAKMEVVNRDIVKQMWIEGSLTDNDLRSILPDAKDPTTALKVE